MDRRNLKWPTSIITTRGRLSGARRRVRAVKATQTFAAPMLRAPMAMRAQKSGSLNVNVAAMNLLWIASAKRMVTVKNVIVTRRNVHVYSSVVHDGTT